MNTLIIYEHQEGENDCGPACVKMLLSGIYSRVGLTPPSITQPHILQRILQNNSKAPEDNDPLRPWCSDPKGVAQTVTDLLSCSGAQSTSPGGEYIDKCFDTPEQLADTIRPALQERLPVILLTGGIRGANHYVVVSGYLHVGSQKEKRTFVMCQDPKTGHDDKPLVESLDPLAKDSWVPLEEFKSRVVTVRTAGNWHGKVVAIIPNRDTFQSFGEVNPSYYDIQIRQNGSLTVQEARHIAVSWLAEYHPDTDLYKCFTSGREVMSLLVEIDHDSQYYLLLAKDSEVAAAIAVESRTGYILEARRECAERWKLLTIRDAMAELQKQNPPGHTTRRIFQQLSWGFPEMAFDFVARRGPTEGGATQAMAMSNPICFTAAFPSLAQPSWVCSDGNDRKWLVRIDGTVPPNLLPVEATPEKAE